MEIEQQVTSLELSRKLKALGVKQESYFYWFKGGLTEYHIMNREELEFPDRRLISAFSVAELGEMLPKETYMFGWVNGKVRLTAWAGIADFNDKRFENVTVGQFDSETEAEARARLMIYLLENNLMETT